MLDQNIQNQTSVEPLLVRHSIPRTGDDKLPGYYDPSRQVWVVANADGITPIVEAATVLSGLETTTKVRAEQDDMGLHAFVDESTETRMKPEQDDHIASSLYALLELSTKTETRTERDD